MTDMEQKYTIELTMENKFLQTKIDEMQQEILQLKDRVSALEQTCNISD